MSTAIPPQLRELLVNSDAEAKTLTFASACEEILKDNKLPFFPAYTDHGIAHVESVMQDEMRLVSSDVWKEELLTSEDAAVLICASYLHDLAMHLRKDGFIALVSAEGTHKPLHWFDEPQRKRTPDLSWQRLWQDFRKEARHFSESDLERILGPGFAEAPVIAFGDSDLDPEAWAASDHLLVGEFLRRHHARLAHEIAISGFPGSTAEEFPVLQSLMPNLADLVGATARSHGEDLRVACEYLDHRDPGGLRPGGAVAHYLMGLLRIADFLQLQPGRATPLLMHLRAPQSPQSIDEWKKHQAVSDVSWDNKDPHAVRIGVAPEHNLRIHLQLGELVDSLQDELDFTAAILSEVYGSSSLASLSLVLQRVYSNLDEPALHRKLRFVPAGAHLRSAEDLFRLVVGDLYGNEPAVAGRELLQNSVDAVRELSGWADRHKRNVADIERRRLDADVWVEVRQVDESSGVLCIVDRGIGMTSETVEESFLTAGASYREAFDSEDFDAAAALRWMKAGRFGIGVLAAFLLGSVVHVATRHAQEDRGVRFDVSTDDDLVEMQWDDDLQVGTEVIVPFQFDVLPVPFEWEGDIAKRYKGFLEQIASFYKLADPEVAFVFQDEAGDVVRLDTEISIPDPLGSLSDQWRSIDAPGFDQVLWSLPPKVWTMDGFPPVGDWDSRIAHNGFVLRKPEDDSIRDAYDWSLSVMNRLLKRPSLAVFDTKQRLGIALNRYELSKRSLDFESQLLRSVGTDVVAQALVVGPRQHPFGNQWGLQPVVSGDWFIPLLPSLCDRYLGNELLVLWHPESTSGDPASDVLLEAIRGVEWERFPARTALTVDEFGINEDFFDEEEEDEGDDDPDTMGFSRRSIRAAVSLGKLLNMHPVAAVALEVGGDLEALALQDGDQDVETSLLNAARTLDEPAGLHSFALTVLRRNDMAFDARDQLLAEPSLELLDRPIARESSDRREQLEGVLRSHPDLRALISSWEMYSETPGWRDE